MTLLPGLHAVFPIKAMIPSWKANTCSTAPRTSLYSPSGSALRMQLMGQCWLLPQWSLPLPLAIGRKKPLACLYSRCRFAGEWLLWLLHKLLRVSVKSAITRLLKGVGSSLLQCLQARCTASFLANIIVKALPSSLVMTRVHIYIYTTCVVV